MTEDYLSMTLREFARLKRLAESAVAQLPADAFFATPASSDNSIAVIVKHVGGNLLSRWTDFLSSDGEKPNRDRDAEFLILADDSRERLMDQWNRGWAELFGALTPRNTNDLTRTVTIRGERLSVLQAIHRQLTHYAYHVGQIVYLAKHYAGPQWTSLSIPMGASKQFNPAPTQYVAKT